MFLSSQSRSDRDPSKTASSWATIRRNVFSALVLNPSICGMCGLPSLPTVSPYGVTSLPHTSGENSVASQTTMRSRPYRRASSIPVVNFTWRNEGIMEPEGVIWHEQWDVNGTICQIKTLHQTDCPIDGALPASRPRNCHEHVGIF